mgnify:CR=1 FL=1
MSDNQWADEARKLSEDEIEEIKKEEAEEE